MWRLSLPPDGALDMLCEKSELIVRRLFVHSAGPPLNARSASPSQPLFRFLIECPPRIAFQIPISCLGIRFSSTVRHEHIPPRS